MHDPAITALHDDGDPALLVQRLTQRVPAVVDAAGLKLQSQRVNEVVRQHADEQVPFHPSITAVENRAQAFRKPHSCVDAGGVLKGVYAGSAATTVAGSAMLLAGRQLCGSSCARSRFFSAGSRSKTSLR